MLMDENPRIQHHELFCIKLDVCFWALAMLFNTAKIENVSKFGILLKNSSASKRKQSI